MEQKQKFQLKFKTYLMALSGFEKSLKIDTSTYPEDVQDSIKNGRIQKFEVCMELTWKIIKLFLYVYHNIDAKSPTLTIKEFHLIGEINEYDYLLLIEMLESRNRLSHEYNEEYFDEVNEKLTLYYDMMQNISQKIKKNDAGLFI